MKHPTSGPAPIPAPDLHAETILFNLYRSMTAERDYWRDKARKAEKKFGAFRAVHLARGVGRALAKPTHNDQPSGKVTR